MTNLRNNSGAVLFQLIIIGIFLFLSWSVFKDIDVLTFITVLLILIEVYFFRYNLELKEKKEEQK